MLKVPSKTQVPLTELNQFMRLVSSIDEHLTKGVPAVLNPKGEVVAEGISAEEYAEAITVENAELLKKALALLK